MNKNELTQSSPAKLKNGYDHLYSLLDILKDESIENNEKHYYDIMLSEGGQENFTDDSEGDDCQTVEL